MATSTVAWYEIVVRYVSCKRTKLYLQPVRADRSKDPMIIPSVSWCLLVSRRGVIDRCGAREMSRVNFANDVVLDTRGDDLIDGGRASSNVVKYTLELWSVRRQGRKDYTLRDKLLGLGVDVVIRLGVVVQVPYGCVIKMGCIPLSWSSLGLVQGMASRYSHPIGHCSPSSVAGEIGFLTQNLVLHTLLFNVPPKRNEIYYICRLQHITSASLLVDHIRAILVETWPVSDASLRHYVVVAPMDFTSSWLNQLNVVSTQKYYACVHGSSELSSSYLPAILLEWYISSSRLIICHQKLVPAMKARGKVLDIGDLHTYVLQALRVTVSHV
ncbi:hypothetical protein Tco_0943454 [Tanacetum coccineum]